jgi:DNA-directed RNA polymerase subunit H (RpoH/RPB5)
MRINELISQFDIWTTNEEEDILKKLKQPRKLSSLSEHDQVRIAYLIRKSLVTKIGHKDPIVVANEKNQN